MSLFVISSYLTAAASVFFGLFVLFKNWRSRVNITWFLTTIAIAIWALSLGMEVSSPDYETAFLWNKILNIGAIFIPIFFYHFIVSFLELEKKEKIFIVAGYLFAITFLTFFNLFTPLFVKGVPPGGGFKYWIEVGPVYYSFFAFFVLYMFRTTYLLFLSRKNTKNIKRAQINYLLIAILFGFGGGVTNFFPQIFNNNIYPFGNYLVVLYVIFISYASLKHHLFNIKVIATELLTIAIWIFLLIKIVLSNNLKDFTINSGLFIAVVFLGILLIRSILQEVSQREKMEEMAQRVQKAFDVEKKALDKEKNVRKELERLDKAKSQFMMATQHHLRTPLTSMQGYLDLIFGGSYGDVPPKIKDVLDKFAASTKNEIKLVNEFLDISQFQMGKDVVVLREGVDVDAIVREAVQDVEIEAKIKGIYVKSEVPEDAPKARADEQKLKAAVYNIVDNAVKYTRKGGVTVGLKEKGDKLQIIIKDTGVGISKEEKDKLFGKLFERGEQAEKLFTTGRGIGLYITYKIVEAHKGKIWVESEGKSKGSTFFIELPISKEISGNQPKF